MSLRDSHLDKTHFASLLRTIIDHFPSSIVGTRTTSIPSSQTHQPELGSVAIGDLIQERLRQWDLGMDSQLYESKFNTAQHLVVTAYNHIRSPPVQAEIAIYTGLLFIVDDQLVPAQAVQEFVPRLCSGSSQLHPVLNHVATTCHTLSKYFPTYGANSVYASTIDFVNSDSFLNESEVKDMNLGRDSAPYVRFMRDKDGIGAAYAAFIWPREGFPTSAEYIQGFPDTVDSIDYINDILSYYKEMKAHDTGTYIAKLAIANQRPEIKELEDLIAYVTTLVQRVRRILGEGKARDVWESFMTGYIRFHLQDPRYQLGEIFPEVEDA